MSAAEPRRIAVLTSLYPSPPRPHEGIFAERRWVGMAARGHRITIVHPQPFAPPAFLPGLPQAWRESARMPRREERLGLDVRRPRFWNLPGRAAGNAERFARAALAGLGSGSAPDACVLDYAWPAARCVSGLAARGIASVLSGRGSDVLQVAGEPALSPRLAGALREVDAFCAVSRDLVEAMERLAERPGEGRLVANGVDTRRFRPSCSGEARASLGLPADGPIALVVGHLIERKDPRLALHAFAAGAPPSAHLYFVGRGPLREALGLEIARLDLSGRAHLVGERPPEELARWYAACDVLMLTSTREGRPNVVLEALASGRPVLVTPAGGTAELPLGAGMLCESREPRVLGDALAALLATPHDAEALAARVAPFSWEVSFEALEETIEAAIARAAHSRGTR